MWGRELWGSPRLLPLLLLLLPGAVGLRCLRCGAGPGECRGESEDCEGDLCGEARAEAVWSHGRLSLLWAGCAQGLEGSTSRGLQLGGIVLFARRRQCRGDSCNSQLGDSGASPGNSSAEAPNGLRCYGCRDDDGSCDPPSIVQCYGDLTACFHGNVTMSVGGEPQWREVRGCARPEGCDGQRGDEAVGLSGSCCAGDLCNHPKTFFAPDRPRLELLPHGHGPSPPNKMADNGADGGAKVADGGAKMADNSTKAADGAKMADNSSKMADGGAKMANSGAKMADNSTKMANSGTKMADNSTKMADGGAKMADGGTKMADGGAKMANSGTKMADNSTKMANSGTKMADGGTKMADGGSEMANSGTKMADNSTKMAAGHARRANSGTKMAAAPTKVNGSLAGDVSPTKMAATQAKRVNGNQAKPNMAAIDPNMAASNPNMAAIDPNMAAANPNMAAIDHNMAAIDPNMAAANPNMAAIDPNMAASNPNMAAIDPNMAAANPNMAAPGDKMAAGRAGHQDGAKGRGQALGGAAWLLPLLLLPLL